MTATASQPENRIITSRWGVSLALVITIVAGVVANLGMMASLRERVASFDVQITNATGALGEIKSAIRDLTSTTHAELRELRRENASLRERVTRLESRPRESSRDGK